MGFEVLFPTNKNPPLISALGLLNPLNIYTRRYVKVSCIRPLVLRIAIELRRKLGMEQWWSDTDCGRSE
jgi:hypothetical protein